MEISRLLLLALLAAALSSIARADGAPDPHMTPIGGTGSIILNSPTDPAFTFSYVPGVTATEDCSIAAIGGTEGDTCIDPAQTEFVNNSGQTWIALTIDITANPDNIAFGCLDSVNDPYFLSCTATTLSDGDAGLIFSGTNASHPGILSALAGSCDSEEGCTGQFLDDGTVRGWDFAILTDITGTIGDPFTAQGSASVAPEPSALVLALVGGAFIFLRKRS